MAATNFTPIILYHTTTASAAPTAGNLNNGELAINITDGKLFYKDNGGTVQVIATKGTGTIGGSNTQVQYNNSGALAGSSNFTFNGTTATINTLNLTNALGTIYGGTGLNSYTTGDLVYASGSNTLAKLGIGLNTYILTSTGSVPQWSAPSAVTVSTANNLAGGAAGSVPYQSGAGTTTFLSIGTQNQVLTSTGSAPQWSSGLTLTTLATTGNTTLGDAAADNLTVNATITSNLIFTDNTYDIGASGVTRPRNLFLANNATIGGLTASKGVFTDANKQLTSTGTLATDQGGTGLASFTAGDLVYYASGTAFTKLGIGTNGQILTSTGSAPQWSTLTGVAVTTLSFGTTGLTPNSATSGAITVAGTLITSNGGTGLASYTAGDLTYYASGTALTRLGIGSAGQILTSSGTAPQWTTLSTVSVTTFSGGTTGLTPSSATSGTVTLGGTLITSNGGTGLSSYTAGDITYYASGTALTKLGIGAANRVLTSSGTAPQWVNTLTGLTSVSATTFTENGYAVVTQADIGSGANEIPLNQYLGSMAYQNGDSYYNIGMTMGFRNRIINGAMQIDQRNAGASVTASDTTNAVYTVDRWAYRVLAASKVSFQQSSTAPSNFKNSLLATSLSAYTVGASEFFNIRQPIEGLNVVDLGWGTSSAQSVTISFWVRSSLTGLFGGYIANSADNRLYIFSYTINAANTWEYKTVTVPGETTGTWLTTNGVGIQLGFSLGAGANYQGTPGSWGTSVLIAPTGQTNVMGTNGATWYITGVQLEVGTQATPFDWRPYGTELQLCQRYYFKATADAAGRNFGLARAASTTSATLMFQYPVVMRTRPTALEQSGTAGDYRINDPTVADYTCSAVPAYSAVTTQNQGYVDLTVASGLTAKTMYFLQSVASTAYLGWSAEL